MDPMRTVQRSAFCRSRRDLSNAYLLAKFGFDTAENESSKVCPIERCSQPFLVAKQVAPRLLDWSRRARAARPGRARS